MSYGLRIQAAAVERQCANYRGFIETRSGQPRWPESDIERARRLLAALEDAALTMRRLAEHEHDERFAELIKTIVE